MPTQVEKGLFKVAVGDTVAIDGTETFASASCGGKTGQWYCATHRAAFENNLGKDSHIRNGTGDHTLAWLCFEHGPEVP